MQLLMESGLTRTEALSIGITEMNLIVLHERHRQLLKNYDEMLKSIQGNGMMAKKDAERAISNLNKRINYENMKFYRDY